MLMLKNVPTYHAFYRKLKDSSSLVKFATALLCVAPLQNMVAESAPTPSVTATETKQLPIPGRPALQQTKQISGKVTDLNGEPIIGANVIEKGTTNGIITDVDGNFSLEVSSSAILQISYIGYVTQEITVGSKTQFSITLQEDLQNLDEVVVIGYGTARKSDLTGATSSLSGEKLAMKNTPQLASQLQGQMAGVQITRSNGDPSSSATIRVRGVTTLSNNDPLVIIDGVPGEMNEVAPEDVKDIQVLKDAASAAIYGSRAAAGVILPGIKKRTRRFVVCAFIWLPR